MHARNHHVTRNIPRTRLQVIKIGVETVENISNNSNRVRQDQINSRQVGSVHDLCRIRVQVIGFDPERRRVAGDDPTNSSGNRNRSAEGRPTPP